MALAAHEAKACLAVMRDLGVEAAIVGEVAGESGCGKIECV